MHEHTWESDAGQGAEEARKISEYLLRIGDGREPTYDDIAEGYVRVPDDMLDMPDLGSTYRQDLWGLGPLPPG